MNDVVIADDSADLLSTKLAPPRVQAPILRRETLLERLDAGLAYRLTLISAPAGAGKTTLVSAWLDGRPGDDLTVGWLSLDEGDNDPVRFWRYVIAACQTFEAGAGEPALALLERSQSPPYEALLTSLINELARLPGKGLLVLEDYHLVTSHQVHETMAFFVEHLPRTVHLLLMTRHDPPLPLARLRARNELNELRAEDLRFSAQESRDFLQQALPFPLAEQAAARLAQRTEGWAAGLRMAALAIQKREDPQELERFVTTFTGSHRPILEYLVGDVLDAQPEALQTFLLETSVLERLTASLCDALTGRHNSVAVLEKLERDNLFLMPLDAAGEWYRFHALFAEAMRHAAERRLGEERLRALSLKASEWYEERTMLGEAVESALRAGAHVRVAGLVARVIAPRLVQNQFHTLRRWMSQIPEEVLRAYPEICMTYAVAILFTSARHAPETRALLSVPLQIAEAHWRSEANESRLGEVLAFSSLVAWLQGDIEQSYALAHEGLALLPDDENQWRGISLIFVGVEALQAGTLNAARETLHEALRRCEAAQNIYGTLDSALLLGDIYSRQGKLHQAAEIFRQVQGRVEDAPMDRAQAQIRRERARLGLGALQLEWNALDDAARQVSRAVDASRQFPREDLLADAPLVLAHVWQAQGRTQEARQLLRSLIARTERPLLLREARALLAQMALAGGDLVEAQRWYDGRQRRDVQRTTFGSATRQADSAPLILQEQEALIEARLCLARGEPAATLALLKKWQESAQAGGRGRSELQIMILEAEAHAAGNDEQRAAESLIQALERARGEGYQRLFLDEGPALAAQLRAALPGIEDEQAAAYGRALLYALAEEQTRTGGTKLDAPAQAATLVEPLSEREIDVLRLLAAGLSNAQIAGELIISVNTVKTHVKNVYQKLAVHNREEARDVARQLDLI